MSDSLPDFVQPMLAKRGLPFDSEEHFFEIKWDGIRALTFAEGNDYRLLSRNRHELGSRYPELGFLRELPAGTLLDGELVVLRDGRPDFSAVLQREQARAKTRIEHLERTHPVTYVVFDLLYEGYRSRMDERLPERRACLRALVEACGHPRLVLSDGVETHGRDLFHELTERKFEGVVAKRLSSTYEAGMRSGAWTKIKQSREALCAILGFMPEGSEDLKSLIIATQVEGELRCVGRVGSGLSRPVRLGLRVELERRVCADAWLENEWPGTWVTPGMYCRVSYLELTKGGALRAPVFVELIADGG